MDLGLRGKVAFVAAGSKGLGRAIAEELAAEGVSLAVNARGADVLERTCSEIESAAKVDVLALPGDVSVPDHVDAMVKAALARFGHIDILVTNAAGPPSGAFETLTPAMWKTAIDITLLSAVNLTRAVLPGMKERRWGRIINVTSITVKQPVQGLMLSNSLRAAVTGFARTLANEVATYGVTVNNILPGYTDTDRVRELSAAAASREGISVKDVVARWTDEIPMGRLGEPREFAALAVFLASERASYITAGSIAVDGGWIKSLL